MLLSNFTKHGADLQAYQVFRRMQMMTLVPPAPLMAELFIRSIDVSCVLSTVLCSP